MKKLILLLLFIPLVSFGQTTLRYDWRSDKLITVYKGNPNIAKIDYSAIRQRKILNNQQKIIRQQQEGFVNQTKILYEQIYTQNLNIEVGDKEHQDFVNKYTLAHFTVLNDLYNLYTKGEISYEVFNGSIETLHNAYNNWFNFLARGIALDGEKLEMKNVISYNSKGIKNITEIGIDITVNNEHNISWYPYFKALTRVYVYDDKGRLINGQYDNKLTKYHFSDLHKHIKSANKTEIGTQNIKQKGRVKYGFLPL